MDGARPLIVRIAHAGPEALDREAWVLSECAARGIRAPRVHGLRRVELEGERVSVMVMEKVPGARLCDIELGHSTLRRVLEELGAWLTQLHSIPVGQFGYLDSRGVGQLATMDDGLAGPLAESVAFEEAGASVGIAATTIRGWLREIADSFRALWLGNGLWRLRWYHETGFRAGAEAARDRLLARPSTYGSTPRP